MFKTFLELFHGCFHHWISFLYLYIFLNVCMIIWICIYLCLQLNCCKFGTGWICDVGTGARNAGHRCRSASSMKVAAGYHGRRRSTGGSSSTMGCWWWIPSWIHLMYITLYHPSYFFNINIYISRPSKYNGSTIRYGESCKYTHFPD